jgi:hypothetical protein
MGRERRLQLIAKYAINIVVLNNVRAQRFQRVVRARIDAVRVLVYSGVMQMSKE